MAVPPPLLLWGGLINEDGPLREGLRRELAALPVDLRSDRIDPALGAAWLALQTLERGGT